MAIFDSLIPRNVITGSNYRKSDVNIQFDDIMCYESKDIVPRIWVSSLTVFGYSVPVNLYAREGGDIENVSSPTAAASIQNLSIGEFGCNIVFVVSLTREQAGIIDNTIDSATTNANGDLTIKLGTANKNQEWKLDKKWGSAIDVSDLIFKPLNVKDVLVDITPVSEESSDNTTPKLYYIECSNFTLDTTKTIDVVHAMSTDRGLLEINVPNS